LFHSKGIADEDASNVSFYSSPTFDGLVDRAKRELDPSRRRELVGRAVRQVYDDAPFAFAYSVRFVDVRQPYLRGYTPHAVWPRNVAFAWLDRKARTSLSGREPRLVSPLGSLVGP
jgi:ABC-type transport system substrate-binding protein